jgi:hypothetical protein
MFADLERYKALERDIATASIVNQFSGLVAVPSLLFISFTDDLQAAGAVTINVDNATCRLQGSTTDYPAYFIPGYTGEAAAIANNFSAGRNLGWTNVIDLFDSELLVTEQSPRFWYPNGYADSSWGRPRQNPFLDCFLFHVGSSKVFSSNSNYYHHGESGLFIMELTSVYQNVQGAFNNNANVRVSGSSMTYEPITPNNDSGIQGLSKNTIINYVRRFPERIV